MTLAGVYISTCSLALVENDRNCFLDAVYNKNQENLKISNRKQSAVLYSVVVPPWYSILFKHTHNSNRTQPEVKPCKAEIWKGKN